MAELERHHANLLRATRACREHTDLGGNRAERKYVPVIEDALLARVLQPWFEHHLEKRHIKSPKVCLRDSKLAHHLLGVHDVAAKRADAPRRASLSAARGRRERRGSSVGTPRPTAQRGGRRTCRAGGPTLGPGGVARGVGITFGRYQGSDDPTTRARAPVAQEFRTRLKARWSECRLLRKGSGRRKIAHSHTPESDLDRAPRGMSTAARRTSWAAQLLAAGILGQTLYFKFSGAPEAVAIFTQLGVEPFGRIGLGVVELVAVGLLLVPRTAAIGGALTLALMLGAVASHLGPLGIEVEGDGLQLFGLALVTLAAGALITGLRRRELLKHAMRAARAAPNSIG